MRGGELLSGVLDKAAFGSTEFGLVHCVNELLGAEPTGRLLTQLGKLFTGYQQITGFTATGATTAAATYTSTYTGATVTPPREFGVNLRFAFGSR